MKDIYELPISTTVAAAGDAFNRALKSFAGYDADLPARKNLLDARVQRAGDLAELLQVRS